MGSFFISYTKPDEEWARWVDRVLRANGYGTFAMFADIPPGTNFVFEMHRALRSGARVLPLLSPAALGSNGMLQEWGNALAGDLGLMARPVIPVRIADCEPDGLLRGLVYVDLVAAANEEAAIGVLTRGVDPDHDPRAQPAPFPGARSKVVLPDVPFPAGDRGNPDWPEYVNSDVIAHRVVVGRDDDVAELRRKLTDNDAAAIVPGAVVKGQGGMGKSTLVRFYYEKYRDRYEGVWWLKAETEQGIVQGFADLAQTLEVGKPGAPQEALARAALTEVQRRKKPWLLIYDDAPGAKEIARWQPATGKVHVLVTSREGNWPKQFAVQQAERLLLPDAVRLLMQEARRDEDVEGAMRLAATLDRLPLALVCAGAWLRDVFGESFDDYLAKWEERLAHKPETIEDYPDSVYGAVKLSLDRLGPDAALLMKVLAFLAPDDLWAGLVTGISKPTVPNPREFWADIPSDLMKLARDGAAVELALAELERRSLAERGEDREGQHSWRIHRLTQAVQRTVLVGEAPRLGSDSEQRSWDVVGWRAVAAAMVATGYPGGASSPEHRENWPLCARLQPHVAALAEDPPATAAMQLLLVQASIYLEAHPRDERALAFVETAVQLAEARLGPEHVLVGNIYNNWAGLLWRRGRLPEAEVCAFRSVMILAKHGAQHAHGYATALSTHAAIVDDIGRRLTGSARTERLKLAGRGYQRALAIDLRLQGRISRAVGRHLNNLATLRAFQGRWGAALRLKGRELSFADASLASGDPQLADCLKGLGAMLIQSGRPRLGWRDEGSLTLLARALAIVEDAFGRPDDRTRDAANWLACAHLVLAELGPPITGTVAPDPAHAEELYDAYELDKTAGCLMAWFYAERARLYESGQRVPPMPGEGE